MISELTWIKLNVGFVWPQLTTDLAISSHQKSLQFKYTFGACIGPQLKFFPSGTINIVCSRTSGSSSTSLNALRDDLKRLGQKEGPNEGFWGLQSFSLESSKEGSVNSCLPVSKRWVGAVSEGDLSLWASLLLPFSECLLSVESSSDTWNKKLNDYDSLWDTMLDLLTLTADERNCILPLVVQSLVFHCSPPTSVQVRWQTDSAPCSAAENAVDELLYR